jgi:DNA-binding transcriptional LysR family regulator
LERSLGARLIERGTHSLRLTDEGQALHARTQGPLAEIAEAGEAVALGGVTPRGRLRISAPVVFAQVALGRIGAHFALAYPEVRLEIVAEDRQVDLVDDHYDLVIRVDPSADERLVGRRVLSDERLLVAPPDWKRPTPSRDESAEIPAKAVTLISTRADAVWRFRPQRARKLVIRPEPVLRFSSLILVRDAVLAGAGVALLPRLLVADDVAAGRLVHWGTEDAKAVEIWALHNSRRLVGAKVRAFMDVLDKAFPKRVFAPPLRSSR